MGGGYRRGGGCTGVYVYVCRSMLLLLSVYGYMRVSACMLYVYLCMCVSRWIYTGSARSLKAFKSFGENGINFSRP